MLSRLDRTEPTQFRVHCPVLIIDDNKDAADTLAMVFQLAGYPVSIGHSVGEALELLDRTLPAAALLDIGLPDGNGYDLARAVRARSGEATLIAVTGWGSEHDRRHARDAGFHHHFTKPADPFSLLELVDRACMDRMAN